MPTQPELIQRAAELCGSQAELAARIKAHPSLISQWVTGHRPVAPRHCIAIELATNGQVTRYALCPEVFCVPEQRLAS